MNKQMIKILLLLLVCLACLMGAAVLHDMFLIFLSLTAIGVCMAVYQYLAESRARENEHLKQLKARAREESGLKIQRELMWHEFLYYIEKR